MLVIGGGTEEKAKGGGLRKERWGKSKGKRGGGEQKEAKIGVVDCFQV